MENPAKLTHIEGSIERPLTDDEKRVIPAWLDRAWRELNRVVPGISARNALTLTDPAYLPADNVRDVVVAMVERKLRNPDGKRQWQGDDYSETVDAALSTGQIYVTANEIASLAPASLAPFGGMYSIPLTAR